MGEAKCGGAEEFGRMLGRRAAAPELDEMFGEVVGAGVNVELSAVDDEPPWHWVTAEDIADVMVAYRRAQRAADDLRDVIEQVGFSEHERPELGVRIDAQGKPAVVLGTLTVSAAEHLRRLLAEGGRAA